MKEKLKPMFADNKEFISCYTRNLKIRVQRLSKNDKKIRCYLKHGKKEEFVFEELIDKSWNTYKEELSNRIIKALKNEFKE